MLSSISLAEICTQFTPHAECGRLSVSRTVSLSDRSSRAQELVPVALYQVPPVVAVAMVRTLQERGSALLCIAS